MQNALVFQHKKTVMNISNKLEQLEYSIIIKYYNTLLHFQKLLILKQQLIFDLPESKWLDTFKTIQQ